MSPSTTSRPWMARPALNVLVSKSVCEGCGCQNERQHLRVEPVGVAGLRVDAVAQALPVVLGGRRDAVAVVAAANLVGGLELAKRFLHRRELRVGRDALDGAPPRCSPRVRWTLFTYCSRQITFATGCASGWLELLRDGGDLRAHLGADVALDEVVDLVEPHERRRAGSSARFTAGLMSSCCASLMMVRFAPPTCLLAPPCVRRPETTWMMRSIW